MSPHDSEDREDRQDRDDGPRRPLSNQGGPATVAGDPEAADLLASAMDVDGVDADVLTHGFHSYPARMHWSIAREVITHFSPEGGRVLDPFCGSGTTMVEAAAAGRSGTGVDLNPLAVRLARLKTSYWDEEDLEGLLAAAKQVAEASEERVRGRVDVRADLPPTELSWYAPHMLKELAGLFEEIKAVEDSRQRDALAMVFSALVVKFSNQRSDTSLETEDRRLRKGLPTEFFLRKSDELAKRLASLAARIDSGPAPERPWIEEHDARDLAYELKEPFDLVLTSPPYGGTYDYVDHHQRRFAWLGMNPGRFERGEIGARRNAEANRFDHEMLGVLRACRRVLAPEGKIVLLMGDGEGPRGRLAADEQIERLAEQARLVPVALASQYRPDFQGGPPRREHLMLLESDGRDVPPLPPRGGSGGRPRPSQGRPSQGRPSQGRPSQGRPPQGRPSQGRPSQDRGPRSGSRGDPRGGSGSSKGSGRKVQ